MTGRLHTTREIHTI